jgi:hypothetical protein
VPVAVQDGDHGTVAGAGGDLGGGGPVVDPHGHGRVAQSVHGEAVEASDLDGGVPEAPPEPGDPYGSAVGSGEQRLWLGPTAVSVTSASTPAGDTDVTTLDVHAGADPTDEHPARPMSAGAVPEATSGRGGGRYPRVIWTSQLMSGPLATPEKPEPSRSSNADPGSISRVPILPKKLGGSVGQAMS